MNPPQTDTLLFYDLPPWTDIGTVVREFNSIGIRVEAIEMISPTQGFIKYESPQACFEAFKKFKTSPFTTRFDFSEPNNFIDLPLAKKMAGGQFICCKTSLDLSCVPVEHLVSLD